MRGREGGERVALDFEEILGVDVEVVREGSMQGSMMDRWRIVAVVDNVTNRV